MIKLVCSHRGVHRPVVIFAYGGPVPLPEWHAGPRPHGSTLDLNCPHCGFRRALVTPAWWPC